MFRVRCAERNGMFFMNCFKLILCGYRVLQLMRRGELSRLCKGRTELH